jgi:hypothetical protein
MIPMLYQIVLDFSFHEYCIPHIHVRASKHYNTHIKWYYIYLNLINIVFTNKKINFTLFSDLEIYIFIYLSQWIWVRMITNFQSNLADQIFCDEVGL